MLGARVDGVLCCPINAAGPPRQAFRPQTVAPAAGSPLTLASFGYHSRIEGKEASPISWPATRGPPTAIACRSSRGRNPVDTAPVSSRTLLLTAPQWTVHVLRWCSSLHCRSKAAPGTGGCSPTCFSQQQQFWQLKMKKEKLKSGHLLWPLQRAQHSRAEDGRPPPHVK